MTLSRFIQGLRITCPDCKRMITPTLVIKNDPVTGETRELHLFCDVHMKVLRSWKIDNVPEEVIAL